jgi:hypothetical protein
MPPRTISFDDAAKQVTAIAFANALPRSADANKAITGSFCRYNRQELRVEPSLTMRGRDQVSRTLLQQELRDLLAKCNSVANFGGAAGGQPLRAVGAEHNRLER